MRKKRLKLKKEVKIVLVIIAVFAFLITLSVNLKKSFDHKNTYEYKLTKIGYSKEDSLLIISKFESSIIDTILTKEKNDTFISLIKNEHFNYDNLDRYYAYLIKDNNIDEAILKVNLNLDHDFYDDVKEADTSKDNLVLVNKYYALASDYVPDNLVKVSTKYAYGTDNKLKKEAYDAFINMWEKANEQDIYLVINLAYRSYKDQETVYNKYQKLKNRKYADSVSARPGHSEHQTGLAMDIFEKKASTSEKYIASNAYTWLKENAYKYGFIERYTEENENITGFSAEPWHYRYVGVEASTLIHEKNITFEEYYAYYAN